MSHLKAVKQAKLEGLKAVLIIEDDIELADNFKQKLQGILELAPAFHVLFLNGTDGLYRKPEIFNEHFNRVREVYGTFGYIIHESFYDLFIEYFERGGRASDEIMSTLAVLGKFYKVTEPLIFHKAGISDIRGNTPNNYKHLEKP